MLTSLALIFLVGLAMAALCQRIGLTRIIGMLITGIVLGPYVLDALDASILLVSADLRKMALVFRPAGVMICLVITRLTLRERAFCVIAFLPKAAVQAAIASVTLAMGLA